MSLPSALGDEVEADAADREHRRALDARLRRARGEGIADWAGLLGAAEGADPRLVARRIRAQGWSVSGLDAPPCIPDTPWTPELHARDFEWYFTRSCARALAARAVALGSRVLCMGTPTVAFALLDHPPLHRLTLIDHNPLVERRHPGAGSLELLHDDLAALRPEAGRYDVAVFDAPWYPATLRRWLLVAATAVRPGGRVLFALLPRLHRPRARAERRALLGAARALGRVRLEPGALRYHSPRFEHEALAAAGLAVPAAWRRADLVELCVARSPAPAPEPREPGALAPLTVEPGWTRFVIGSQVVHLAEHAAPEPGDVLAPIDERGDFRYPSISTRDPRRARIGLWTSRSRVARVRRPAVVAALLERLAQTGDPRALDDAPALRGLQTPDRRRLLDALQTLLGP